MTHAALGNDHATEAGRHPAGEGQVGGKLYAFVDAVTFVGVLNMMIVVMTFAGGVFLGAAPAHAAAAGTVRARLRGDGGSTVARFVRVWRGNFVRANRLQGPGLVAGMLLSANLLIFGSDHHLLGAALVAALVIVVAYQIILVAMDAHYDLKVRECRARAWRFLLVAPGAPLLLAAAICVIAFVTWLLPGLLPVFSLGAAAYITTALCLSFFAANDKRVAA